ncbi:MAG: hypothetical protein M5U12_35125 [Verrucomicrobia bacterium]|nr:hypothetical protein [Verrucomicrobiota bacterium]
MRKGISTLALLTISMLAVVRMALAQDPSIARLVHFSAPPASRVQIEDAIKKQMDWRREQGDSWRWLTWEYASGEVPRYCVATFGHDWADFDAMPLAGRAEEAGGGLASTLSALPPVVQYFEHLAEVSDYGSPTNTPTVAEISLYQLHYGKQAQFYAALREFHAALSRVGGVNRYEWFELRSGGETPQFLLLLPRANWAAFDVRTDALRDALEQALGKRKAARVFEQFTAAVRLHVRCAVRLRPDLSLLPAAGDSRP